MNCKGQVERVHVFDKIVYACACLYGIVRQITPQADVIGFASCSSDRQRRLVR